jgi:hypothetical protein
MYNIKKYTGGCWIQTRILSMTLLRHRSNRHYNIFTGAFVKVLTIQESGHEELTHESTHKIHDSCADPDSLFGQAAVY